MGPTLLELIKNGSISKLSLFAKFKLIKDFIKQISNLIIDENKWIVHNDIKLNNITIKNIDAFKNNNNNDDELCNVSLIDFGISYFSEYGLPRQLNTNGSAFSPAYILLTKKLQENIPRKLSYKPTIADLHQLQFWGILNILYDVIMDEIYFFSHRSANSNNITIADLQLPNVDVQSKIWLLRDYLKNKLIESIKDKLKNIEILLKESLLNNINNLINTLIMEEGNLMELDKVIDDILELLMYPIRAQITTNIATPSIENPDSLNSQT